MCKLYAASLSFTKKGYFSPLVFSTEVPRELACQEGITSVGEKYR